jgi:hypothetical protein
MVEVAALALVTTKCSLVSTAMDNISALLVYVKDYLLSMPEVDWSL